VEADADSVTFESRLIRERAEKNCGQRRATDELQQNGAVDVLNILISLCFFALVQTPVSYSKHKGNAHISHRTVFSARARGKC